MQCTGSVAVVDTDKKIRTRVAEPLLRPGQEAFAAPQGPSVLQDDKNKLVLKAEWIESDNDKRGHSRARSPSASSRTSSPAARSMPFTGARTTPRADRLALGVERRRRLRGDEDRREHRHGGYPARGRGRGQRRRQERAREWRTRRRDGRREAAPTAGPARGRPLLRQRPAPGERLLPTQAQPK